MFHPLLQDRTSPTFPPYRNGYLNAVIPAGYTASWTYYNIFNKNFITRPLPRMPPCLILQRQPYLTLTKKANHDIDPAYRAVLRITSINNPNCWYEDDAIVRFIPNPQISLLPPTTDVTHRRIRTGTSV
ncbi:hypothetical protein EJ377_01600 [Chryseobacterium arthrosphaerae]|uniref:Uncharacterized protein n=1 Tax=Chryseobacterium arthrosphaerae TaxID=651561 RepID=A0A432DYT7_9FLAO|nr:hypothetical protein EJ377_01600 [Chryseobacterium arthrosphaerae]